MAQRRAERPGAERLAADRFAADRPGAERLAAERLAADGDGIARAAALLRAGACVAFPTETVYGLGAVATDGRAVAGIFAAKERPSFNPLIVHVPDLTAALSLAVFDEDALALARAFWPGPLTLVLPVRGDAGLSDLVTAGLTTVGVRVPAHPVARALLSAVALPVAAPSANPSGRVSPTTADHVLDGLRMRIAAVVDGGPCEVGVESTIVATGQGGPGRAAPGSASRSAGPALLRPGGLPAEAIAGCIGRPLTMPGSGAGAGITAPGQLASHYAPTAPVRLDAVTSRPGEVHLGFGAVAGDLTLSRTGDLAEAAAALFAALRRLDDGSGRPIAVAPIPHHGLGLAINDRLRRAAAPRG